MSVSVSVSASVLAKQRNRSVCVSVSVKQRKKTLSVNVDASATAKQRKRKKSASANADGSENERADTNVNVNVLNAIVNADVLSVSDKLNALRPSASAERCKSVPGSKRSGARQSASAGRTSKRRRRGSDRDSKTMMNDAQMSNDRRQRT